jgi:hypothetical protein
LLFRSIIPSSPQVKWRRLPRPSSSSGRSCSQHRAGRFAFDSHPDDPHHRSGRAGERQTDPDGLVPSPTVVMFLSLLVASMNIHDGETNAIEGMTHFVLFMAFLMLAALGV